MKWKFIIPSVFATISLVSFGYGIMLSPFRLAMYPGHWYPNVPVDNGYAELLIVAAFGLLAVGFALGFKKWVLAVSFLGLFVFEVILLPGIFERPSIDRFRKEKSDYQRALQTKAQFGNQMEDECNGRRLVYWEWLGREAGGGFGIIYDPQDKLNPQKDSGVFPGNSDHFFVSADRLESNWYFVNFG